MRKAHEKTERDKDFWTTADPWIDAWMILTREKREVFNITTFVKEHPDMSVNLQSLRPAAKVKVMSSRCPLQEEYNGKRGRSNGGDESY